MTKITETRLWSKARSPEARRVLRRALVAVVIVGVTGLFWYPVFDRVYHPLTSVILIGALMLSLIGSAVSLIRSARRQ